MDEENREVNFKKYCSECKHKDTDETSVPCCECLEYPVNQFTDRPVKYEVK